MSPGELAGLQVELGARIVQRDGCFWRRVRPWFYRPLVPTQARDGEPLAAPCGWPGGFQYVVADPGRANSTMNFIVLDGLAAYSLDQLGHKRRNLINAARRYFEVRPVEDVAQLKAEGYGAFLSFYGRTKYAYRADRARRARFEAWAETLMRSGKVLVLGGFEAGRLVAVSCSYRVDGTLIYATLFSETEALKRNLGELMFHGLREIAAGQRGLEEIFVRSYQGGNSLDRYYLLRGGKLVRRPARLELSGSVRRLLRWVAPRQYALLSGAVEEERNER